MLKGAYAFVIMTEDQMIMARDPNGLRPLSLGKIGDAYVVASETCALDIVGAEFIRDIEPGELVVINDEGITSEYFCFPVNMQCVRWNMCIFPVPILILMELMFIRLEKILESKWH